LVHSAGTVLDQRALAQADVEQRDANAEAHGTGGA
jgi:hypothetical protein